MKNNVFKLLATWLLALLVSNSAYAHSSELAVALPFITGLVLSNVILGIVLAARQKSWRIFLINTSWITLLFLLSFEWDNELQRMGLDWLFLMLLASIPCQFILLLVLCFKRRRLNKEEASI